MRFEHTLHFRPTIELKTPSFNRNVLFHPLPPRLNGNDMLVSYDNSWIWILLILCHSTHCFGQGETTPAPYDSIVYKTIGDVELRLHRHVPTNHQKSACRPAVVFFFGGGWKGGTPKQFEPHCQYLASRGMVALTAEYRVENRHGTTPFDAVRDAKSALRWIRKNAQQLGIDPQRIAAGGGSAGGHLAAATAMIKGFDVDQEEHQISCKPNALLLFNPVYDNGPGSYGHERIGDRYPEFSPLHNIQCGLPPTLVFFGTQDALVPLATIVKFDSTMKDFGNRCETHYFEGQGHGFFNKGRHDDKFYQQTVAKMDRFLVSLNWIK